MSRPEQKEYPFGQTSYIATFDDGQLARHELKESEPSWRSESYAKDSSLRILDHHQGVGTIRTCNNRELDEVLAGPPRQLRIFLLLPTVHERIAEDLFEQAKKAHIQNGMTEAEAAFEVSKAAAMLKKNELYDKAIVDPADPQDPEMRREDRMNISRDALLKIITKYDIAPGTCSHIRGQEQIFGSRTTKNKNNEVTAVEFWYAIRARAYFRDIDKDADLKMTVVTKYDVATKSTVVLLKYRSFNDLATKLKVDLVSKLEELIQQPETQDIAHNPFAVSLLHFNCTAQWYRRAARDPRDSVRDEEEKAHVLSKQQKNELKAINVRRLHLTMRNLDQDKLQLNQTIGTIKSLRKQHESFQKYVMKKLALEDRDWLYLRVDEEMDRLDDQLRYLRASIEDVCGRAQRLLDLLFNLVGQQSARWSEKVGTQAMHESANMRAIAIVSMLFLPGTFISGILGTNLFSQEENKSSGPDDLDDSPFRAARQWWILLVTIFPLTFVTFLGWWVWRRRSEAKIKGSIMEEDEKDMKMQELKNISKMQRKGSLATIGSSLANFNNSWFRRFGNGETYEMGRLPK